jgi:flagellin
MSRINTNISSIIAQANLSRTQNDLNVHLERLSTGLKINRGKDDPAGLIISERLRSNVEGVNQGIDNAQRADSVISTAEGALAEVNDLLNSVRGLIVQSANTGANSAEERDANQLQIDSAIDSITRISNTASFGGLKLLDGSLDYTLSGLRNSAITTAKVRGASFAAGTTSIGVNVDVIASAQTGGLYYNGGTVPAGQILSSMSLEIKGPSGVQVVTVASGTSLAALVSTINGFKAMTGVQASLINGNANSGIVFNSVAYGSDAFVSVQRQGGPPQVDDSFQTYRFANNAPVPANVPFSWATLIGSGALESSGQDNGRDVSALINGNLANGRGLNIGINTPSLSVDLTLDAALATQPSAAPTNFTITGGGALFQLGPDVTALQQTNLGIPSVAASRLGATKTSVGVEYLNSLRTGGTNSIANSATRKDFTQASDILAASVDDITTLRGRLGAFEANVLSTNVRSLQSQYENLTASESQIRDADFAVETSAMTRDQILSSAGTSTLSLANQQSQQVLRLLGQ